MKQIIAILKFIISLIIVKILGFTFIISLILCKCSGDYNDITYYITEPDSTIVESSIIKLMNDKSLKLDSEAKYTYEKTISGRNVLFCRDSLFSINREICFSFYPEGNILELQYAISRSNNRVSLCGMSNKTISIWKIIKIKYEFEKQIIDKISFDYDSNRFWNYLFIYLVFFNQCKNYILGIFTLIVIIDLYRKRKRWLINQT